MRRLNRLKQLRLRRLAFTLVEVLVSSFVLGILTLSLVACMQVALTYWDKTSDQVLSEQNVRTAMNVICNDLHQGSTSPTDATPDAVIVPSIVLNNAQEAGLPPELTTTPGTVANGAGGQVFLAFVEPVLSQFLSFTTSNGASQVSVPAGVSAWNLGNLTPAPGPVTFLDTDANYQEILYALQSAQGGKDNQIVRYVVTSANGSAPISTFTQIPSNAVSFVVAEGKPLFTSAGGGATDPTFVAETWVTPGGYDAATLQLNRPNNGTVGIFLKATEARHSNESEGTHVYTLTSYVYSTTQ